MTNGNDILQPMPVQTIDTTSFLDLARSYPVFDVRSPGEFAHAHIPGALSLPLFTDEQRSEIGTTYRQVSREDAIKAGLRYFGPNMENMVVLVEQALKRAKQQDKTVLVHCWRGGMRSGAVAWLLGFYGFDVYLLGGGYKAYRNHVLSRFAQPFRLNVIGGYTGSGKTQVLHELEKRKEAVIDLEKLAGHKGSAFGSLNRDPQPTQEQFENDLHHALSVFDTGQDDAPGQLRSIWIENESQRIGAVNIPGSFHQCMQASPLYVLDIPFGERLSFITESYGKADKEKLVNAIIRIGKKLGGLDTKNAINFLLENNIRESFRILLRYYDKRYSEASDKNERKPQVIASSHIDAAGIADRLLHLSSQIPT